MLYRRPALDRGEILTSIRNSSSRGRLFYAQRNPKLPPSDSSSDQRGTPFTELKPAPLHPPNPVPQPSMQRHKVCHPLHARQALRA